MERNQKTGTMFVILSLVFGICLFLFYLKYVPLVLPFQMIFLPILLAVFLLTVVRLEWGILFFIFCFPLISSLPYFFGIYEPVPHAPAALVLFLFFFGGWLAHHCLHSLKPALDRPIFRPIILLSCLICVSGVLTFMKYSNFFPFLTPQVYEFVINVEGATSGGAIMSIIFFALNYLTGFAFFFVLLKMPPAQGFVKKISFTFCLSMFFALGFGLFQHIENIKLGNNPISIQEGLINATFKDALSFGAVIAMAVPLILGLFFSGKGKEKIFYFPFLVLACYMIFHSGSRGALLSLGLSVLLFISLGLKVFFAGERKKSAVLKKHKYSFSLGLVFTLILIFSLIIRQSDIFHSRAVSRWRNLAEQGISGLSTSQRVSLWKISSRIMGEYPISGIGIGSFIIEVSNFSKIYGIPIQCSESAENYFLQVGTELGFLGLFLAAWIFWGILKQIRKLFRQFPLHDKKSFLLIGVSVGLFAFFINIQFHSYIGSYEVKYIFWLMAALVFRLGGGPEEVRGKTERSRAMTAAGVVALLLVGAWQFWNSTHTLSLKARTEQLDLKQDFGFYDYEKTQDNRVFRWSGEYGGLTIKVEKPVIKISLQAAHPDVEQRPVEVKIYLIKDFFKKKMLLDEVWLSDHSWRSFEYSLPGEINREVILLMKVSRTWNPLKSQGVPDPRNLGVALGEIQLIDRPDFRQHLNRD